MSALYSIDEIKQRLAQNALSLAQTLVPDGRLKGPNWWFRNPRRPDGGNYHTASVNIRRGLWKDFSNAGGGEGGDIFHFVTTFAADGDPKRGWRWSLDWLGLTGKAPDRAQTARLAAQAAEAAKEEARRLARTRGYCLHLWFEAKPLDGHDPASLYLAGRGIDVQAIAEGIPRALRFHGDVEARTGETPRQRFPALLAIATLEGTPHGLATIHQTYLEPRAGYYVKADRGELPSKEVICAYAGSSARLQRGKSGKALKDAPAGSSALISEGIENALTAALVCPEQRVLAALSLANLANVVLPPAISEVTLLADNDGGNEQALAGLARAIAAHHDAGREVKIARAPAGKDFNEALTAGAA